VTATSGADAMAGAPRSPDEDADLLTLDLGNTTLDALRTGAAGTRRSRLRLNDAAALRGLLEPPPERIVICSVVEEELRALRPVLAVSGARLLVAGRDLPCPLAVRYRDPAQLGSDRWVAALAAHRALGSAIVVDCGTAVTVDAVSAEGVFLGGAIAAGARAMARGLEASAPGLPPARLDADLAPIPLTTTDAVAFGVQVGFCGAVERLIDAVARATGMQSAPCVLTGGDAELVLRHTSRRFEHVPDLIHRGLRHLWRDAGRP
jgi:type III pantothenate kinase